MFSEIELVLNDMKLENVKPPHEAMSVVVRAYADNYSTCIIAKGLCKEGKVEEARKLIEERL